jgi:putative FmdB family regulatory protein
MPIYEYRSIVGGCVQCQNGFELLQKISANEMQTCPSCGALCQRLISAPSVISGSAHVLQEGHLSKHGFSQYRRVAKGHYEKSAGPGPSIIKDDL